MNKKLTVTAGRCSFNTYSRDVVIEFSSHIFDTINVNHQYNVIAHEISHGICFTNNIDFAHGINWKRICLFLGGDGNTTHHYPVKRRTLTWNVIKHKDGRVTLCSNNKLNDIMANPNIIIAGKVNLNYNKKSYTWKEQYYKTDVSSCFKDWKEE